MGSCVVIGCEVEVGFYRWNFILRGKENRNYKVIAVGERIQGRFCKGMLKIERGEVKVTPSQEVHKEKVLVK